MKVLPNEILSTRTIDGGEPNRVPLCISSDGKRMWCRRRDAPYHLVVASVSASLKNLEWTAAEYENGTKFSFGPCKKISQA